MLDFEQLDNLAAAFSVLGRFHRNAPDEQTLLTFWELSEEWPLSGTQSATDGLTELRIARKAGETSERIKQDHTYLYGHTAIARVAPYESVHRGLDGLVFDEQTLEVRHAYRSVSLQAPRLNKEPDDHIGLEFDFIAQTSLKALDALDAGSHDQAHHYVRVGADFLQQHLLQWAPEMLTRMVAEARTHFMKGIGLLSLGALETYAALAAESLDSPDPH